MNMTDHKYPHEVTSCHNMLKKRDAIIDQLQAEKQDKVTIPCTDEQLITHSEDLSSKNLELQQELATIKETRDSLSKACDLYKAADSGFRQEINALTKQLAKHQEEISEVPVEGNMVLLKNQIAEQKRDILAHMNKIDELLVEVKDYRTLQSVLKKVLDNGD